MKAVTFEGLLFAHSAVVIPGISSNNNFCQQRERERGRDLQLPKVSIRKTYS